MRVQGRFCAAAFAAALAGSFAAANPGQQAAPVDPDVLAKQRVLAALHEAGAVPQTDGGSVLRGVCPNSVTRTPNLPIPQFAGGIPGEVTDQVTTAGDPLLNVRVQLIIPHTWQGDVIARLRHEASGTEVTLIDRPGVPELSTVGFLADNYGDNASGIPFVLDDTAAQLYGPPDLTVGINNVTGPWRPDDASFTLAAFNGLTADTTWTLTVTDNAGGDLGTLVRWTICSDNPIGQGIPTGIGSATPNPTTDGSLVTFTVQVSPALGPPSTGLGVVADLSSLGGSASQMFFDDGSNGDVSPGDNLFTYQTVVSGTSGVYSLPFTVSDAQARSSIGTIGLTLVATNDFCEAAIPVAVGSSIVTTNDGATNDTGLPTCNGLSTFNAGVWFTTTGNGNVLNVTTCSPNTTLNTRLYIYTGSCGSFTCVNAATGTTPACSPTTAASVQFCSTLGETYYILVTNDTTGTGQFELSVLDQGPCLANDNCETAINLPVGSSTIGNNVGAFNDPGLPTCNSLSTFNAGVWYTTTGNGNVLDVTTCGPNTTLNTRLYVYTGSCGSFTCVNASGGTSPACSPSTAASVQFCSTLGETYYILVTNDTTGTGQFDLSVTDIGPCPTNDLCENAIDVPVGTAIVANNIGATNDAGQPTCNGLSTFNAGVWFTTTGNGNILSVSTCGSNTTLNTRLYVFTGFCGAFTCTTASGGTTPACTPSTAATVAFCSSAGQTYYILVTNDTTGTGVFDLSVTDAGPCPTNDNCPGDVVTAPSSTPGTTVGLTPSGVTSCGANSADAYYSFTPTVSGSYTIDLCGSAFDTRLSIFTDCTTTQIGCNDDSCGAQSSLTLDLSSGVEYHIRVSAFGATTTGAFILNISAPPIPTGACCISGACSILSQADCTAGGGVYQGDDVSCGAVGPTEFTYNSDPFLAITDNGCTAGYQQDSINVPDSFTVGDVNVRVQVPDHTFIGDLQIRLTNGVTTVLLMDDQCGTNAGMDITFDDDGPVLVCTEPTVGTFRPTGTTAGLLSEFNGASSSGTWTLEICDDAGIDTGTLTSWSLILRDTAPGPCDGPQFCDADWCQDGEVGVPDIFCFLSDWFSMDPDARCFGGTCEVPAIFAFLSVWFAAGQGPCTP